MRALQWGLGSVVGALLCSAGGTSLCGAQSLWPSEKQPSLSIPQSATALIASATRLPGGQIAVADAARGLSLFDAQGKMRWSAEQRPASGMPAEPTWVGACGRDSLYVWDAAENRLAVLDRAGVMVREVKLGSEPLIWTARCSATGAFAFQGWQRLAPRARSMMDRTRPYQFAPTVISIVVTDASGRQTGILRDVSAGEIVLVKPTSGGALGGPRPFGSGASVSFTGTQLVVGVPDSGRVGLFDATAKQQAWLAVSARPVRLDRAVYFREIRWLVPTFGGIARDRTMALFDSLPFVAQAPPFTAVFGDPAGLVWRSVLDANADVTVLRGMTNDGQDVAELRLPEAMRVFEVGTDYVLGWTIPTAGGSRIVMFKFTRKR